MFKKVFLVLFVAGAMMTSCNKEEGKEEKGKATVYVEQIVNEQGKALVNVELELANVDDNFSLKKIYKAKTDYTGKAFFTDLDKGNYVVSKITPSYDLLGSTHIRNVLFTISEGENVQKTLQFKSKECFFKLKNTSSNPYSVYINNKLPYIFKGGQETMLPIPSGIVNVRVLQQSGYILYPTEKNYTKDIDCTKKEITISFP